MSYMSYVDMYIYINVQARKDGLLGKKKSIDEVCEVLESKYLYFKSINFLKTLL